MPDKWLTWLREKRFGGTTPNMEGMYAVRDKVLENSKVKEGDTILDVGTGDGLIASAALDKVGPTGKVIFSDISLDALDFCREYSRSVGALKRSQFVLAPASDLHAIADNSVDIVTTRSVLIYEPNKQKAFEEFYRVLKPDGWISLFEPIGRVVKNLQRPNTFSGYDVLPIIDLMEKVMTAYRWNNTPDNPMGNFDERDLVRFSVSAGFSYTKVELEIQSGKSGIFAGEWEHFYHSSPNPNAPSLKEAVDETLKSNESQRLIDHLRPLVEKGDGWVTQALCYLTSNK